MGISRFRKPIYLILLMAIAVVLNPSARMSWAGGGICVEQNRRLTDEEALRVFIDSELTRFGNWWRTNRIEHRFRESNLIEENSELFPIGSADELLRLFPGCCLLDQEVPGSRNGSVVISRQVKSVPPELADLHRSKVAWAPAMKRRGKNGKWEVVLLTSGPISNPRTVWFEGWIDHCGKKSMVPLKYKTG